MTDSNVPPNPEWTPPPADHSAWAPGAPVPPQNQPPQDQPPQNQPPQNQPPQSPWAAPPPQHPQPWAAPPPQQPWAAPPPQPQQWNAPPPQQQWSASTPPPAPGALSFELGQPSQDEMLGYPTPSTKSRRGLIAAVAAVVVVLAGAAVTYTALSDASSGNGASSPQGAVNNAITDLHNGDVIGLLDDMPSGERAALIGPLEDDVTSLKRLGVLSPAADPHKVTGVTFTASNIQFAPATIVVNDHVQIVRITGGTITANADAMKLPLSAHMLDITHASASTAKTQTTNLAGVSGGVRIATVEQSGRWYVSIFYTAADAAAKHQIPSSDDYIPAQGAATPVAAIQNEVTDLVGGKLSDAIGLISPDELGALHDYGGLVLSATQGFPDTGVKINTLDLNQTALSDGAVRVTVARIALTLPNGETVSVSTNGSCFTITISGTAKQECAADSIKAVEGALSSFRCLGVLGAVTGSGLSNPGLPTDGSAGNPCGNSTPLTSAQKTALTHLIAGETGLGFIVSQTNGQWYFDPVRTITELTSQTIGSLQGNDLFALVSIFTG